MITDGKPKRKHEESSNSLDFVTALTVEQCVERLEKGPAHTLDYRLTVRTDGQRFIVEVWGDKGGGHNGVIAEFNGNLEREGNDMTRVGGTTHYKNPYYKVWILALMPLASMVFCIAMVAVKEDGGFTLGILSFTIAVFFVQWFYRGTRIEKQTPDLSRWLMEQLYEPPEQPTP